MPSNQEQIAAYLSARGLSPAQVSGVLGNLQVESGFSPTAYNAGERAIGIAQWEGPRRTALQAYARATGGSERSLATQLGFLWHELTGSESRAYAKLRATSTPGAAAAVFDQYYERSSGAARAQRVANAQRIAGTLGGSGLGVALSPIRGGTVTTRFGKSGSLWSSGAHTGDDYAAPVGTPVYATLPGTVIAEGASGGSYGTWIKIKLANGFTQIFGHLSSDSVTKGQQVAAGQVIGKVGRSGNATGPHLHYEFRDTANKPVDPASVKGLGGSGAQNVGLLDPSTWLGGGPIVGGLRDQLGIPGLEDIPGVDSATGWVADKTVGAAVHLVNEDIIKPAWVTFGDLVTKSLFVLAGLGVVAVGVYRLSQNNPTAAAATRAAGAPIRTARRAGQVAAAAETGGASAAAGAAASTKPKPKPAPAPKPAPVDDVPPF